MCHARLISAVCLTLFGWGCNQSNSVTGEPNPSTATVAQAAPEGVVGKFLEAVRVGDDKQAALLLTPLAREKTAEMQMVVAPPGSDTASFRLGDVTHSGDIARVASDWTDLDTDGRPHTDRIVWILRKGAEGWRIAGMETPIFADQDPIALNFEDPAEMLSKQQRAEDEIARRQREQALQAKKSAADTDSKSR